MAVWYSVLTTSHADAGGGPQQSPPTPLSGDELPLPQPSKCPCCSCSRSQTLSERLATGHPTTLDARRTAFSHPRHSYQDLSFSRRAAHHSLDFLQRLCPPLGHTIHGYLNPNNIVFSKGRQTMPEGPFCANCGGIGDAVRHRREAGRDGAHLVGGR